MASQMGKKDILKLKTNEYWITEKSDGCRMMFFGMIAHWFPMWYDELSDVAGTEKKLSPVPFEDSLALEHHYITARNAQQPSSDPFLLPSTRDIHWRVHTQPSEGCLEVVCEENHQTRRMARIKGCTFGYVFDRNYHLHLCIENWSVPTVATVARIAQQKPPLAETAANWTNFLCLYLLDGELLWSLRNERWHYSVFDIVALSQYCPKAKTTVATNFYDQPMSARFKAIDELIVSPLHAFRNAYNINSHTPTMFFVAKHFYPKAEVTSVLKNISKTEGNHYLYEGYEKNLNDGLVFTPEDPGLFSFKPGGAANLLKWKWPDKLTADFKIDPTSDYQDGIPIYVLQWYSRQGDQHFVYKRVPILTSPDIPYPTETCIAECGLDTEKGLWIITTIRTDKDRANGLPAVSSTLENIVQNFVSDDLVKYLTTPEGENMQAEAVVHECEAHFKLELHPYGRNEPQLQFTPERILEQTGPYKPRETWLSYVPLSHCYTSDHAQFDEEVGNQELVQAMRDDMPEGGFIRARFDRHRGRWQITSGNGVKERATAASLLDSLERMACQKQTKQPTETLKRPAPAAASNQKKPSRKRAVKQAEVQAAQLAQSEVGQHYNKVTNIQAKIGGSERSVLRKFNNWIKAVLVSLSVPTQAKNEAGFTVLDLCCGRGGDIGKWTIAGCDRYVGIDISKDAVLEARSRAEKHNHQQQNRFKGPQRGAPGTQHLTADFCHQDCFGDQVVPYFMRQSYPTPFFDVVSCQFAVHYAFESEAKVRQTLTNVTRYLKPKGWFVGTTVDERVVLSKLKEHGKLEKERVGEGRPCVAIENSQYRLEMLGNSPEPQGTYKVEYNFSLEESVQDCAEYLIRWDNFVRLAAEFGLREPIELPGTSNFMDFWRRYRDDPAHQETWQRVVGVDPDEETQETAGLYRVFMFQKGLDAYA
eukprot:TRINITY_DN56685_c0_g1_i1.p1 TRINITY_DN56685_c0_g1~~TRINITY_DN56685_c0_g1_i1.p1  ORF type:complete len:930 (+),score=47.74 TRINITY_DN56685_c0_g1_i1:1-2790(+)